MNHFEQAADQNLPYQQNLRAIEMPVVLVHARSSRMADLRPLVAAMHEAIASVRSGEVRLWASSSKG